MKKIFSIFLLTLTLFTLNSCKENKEIGDINYVSFEAKDYQFGVELTASTTNEINVYSSTVFNYDRTLDIKVSEDSTLDMGSYTLETTVTIPANSNVGSFSLKIDDVNIESNDKVLILDILPKKGYYIGESMNIYVKQVCPYNDVVLAINFDGYASETSYELKNASGVVIASVNRGTWEDGFAEFSTNFCLQDGTYTFTVGDSYGDGLSYPSNGDITLTLDGNVLVSIVGDFGSSSTATFTVPN